jgi:hypothetical protein
VHFAQDFTRSHTAEYLFTHSAWHSITVRAFLKPLALVLLHCLAKLWAVFGLTSRAAHDVVRVKMCARSARSRAVMTSVIAKRTKTDTSLGRHFQNQWHLNFLRVKYFLDILCIQTEGDGSILTPSTYRDYMERPCHSRILSPTFSFVFHVHLTSEMYG